MGEAESNPELQSNGATEISDWTDLNDIRNDLTGDYVLVSDLNENTAGYDTYVDTADGWDSIGGLNDGFKGSLNGQGFTINDLLIDRPDSNYQALFSFSSGDISNVSLENVNITGQALVGGLVAENSGTVSNSYVTGEINSTTGDTSPSNAGGLVGYNYNVIEDSYSNGYVNGSTSVGGLVGKNEGNIDDSYSTSNVNGDPYNCGGLVGSNEGYINNTYATGDVTVSGDHSQGDA
ncbi:MAG: GLUG motif-containing protein, partial [Thermoplasmata archaeon]